VAVDSDTLYVLATGISIVSVLVVVVAKYWFGKGEDNDRTAEEENDQAVQGTFGKLPIAEWKQHKSALDQEYRERFMETPNSPKADMDNDEKEPLLSFSPDDDVSDAVDNKTVAKVVRFQDDSGDRRQSDQNDEDDAESIKGQQITYFGRGLERYPQRANGRRRLGSFTRSIEVGEIAQSDEASGRSADRGTEGRGGSCTRSTTGIDFDAHASARRKVRKFFNGRYPRTIEIV